MAPPGVREIYHPHDYGGYILDPDGKNIEAVCHRPAWPVRAGGLDRPCNVPRRGSRISTPTKGTTP